METSCHIQTVRCFIRCLRQPSQFAAGYPFIYAAQTIEFEPLAAPVGDEKHQVRTSKKAVYNSKTYDISYKTVVRSGDLLPLVGNSKVSWPFGLVIDQDGE